MMNPKIFMCMLLLLLMGGLRAQEIGSWWMYFGSYRVSNHWSLWTEVQYRSHDHGSNIEQLLLRTAANYHLSKNSMFTAGYGYIGNYALETDIKKASLEENRIYEQYIHKHLIPHVAFEHRFRVEQRWLGEKYLNRLRYRLMLTFPFGKHYMEEKTFFLAIYDEIFLNTVQEYYNINRFYVALGRQFDQYTSVQMGMLNQDTQISNKWYFQLALIWNPDFRKE